jgi:hypothetical protein
MTTATIADGLVGVEPAAGAEVPAEPVRVARRGRSLPVLGRVAVMRKIVDVARLIWADICSAWWTPASLPTLAAAWADRIPDREKVPGGNGLLYGGWLAYNHTLRLAFTALVLAGVGGLSLFGWIAQHPARLVLFTIVATATAALIIH